MRPRLRPILAIVGLALIFFGALVVHPTWVLYADGSDLLGLHVPIERYLIGSWRATGEVPLWCPHRFGGSPFLHDLQVAAFYPPHLILYALPTEAVGAALSWLVVAHVMVAGLGMYAYARSRELERGPALVAALGFMFSGKWMLHLLGGGHYMTVGLAWLPVVLLLLEAAIRRRSLLRATWAGAAFALLALGTHPQWTLYAGVFLAPWTLGAALEAAGFWGVEAKGRRVGEAIGWWLACGGCAATVAILLVAVQLLPAMEAATQATRNVVGTSGMGFGQVPMTLLSLIGPPALGMRGFDDWEYRGGVGVLWACAAIITARQARGRDRYQAAIWLGLIAFSLGGAALLQGLPGFRLFVLPSRMLLIATLPAALLAAGTTQALFAGPAPTSAEIARSRRILLWATIGATVSFAGMAGLRGPRAVHGHLYWIVLAGTVPASFVILGRGRAIDPTRRRRAGLAWNVLLLVDLWAMAAPHVETRPESAIFPRPACVDYLIHHRDLGGRVLDRHLPNQVTRTPVSSPLAMMEGLESIRGYNPMDIHRFREFLQFIADRDGPVPPIRQVANFPIRNKGLLDLLGVRYLVEPAGEPTIAADPRWRKVLDDPRPRTFNIFAGMAPLPAYAVYENRETFPRAFVVPDAAPLPARSRLLGALKSNDFRRRVFLEDYPAGPRVAGSSGPALIRRSRPDRVDLAVDLDAPGFLVLADPWFPGWSATVDGRPTRLYRANYLFRAVAVPAGRHEVVFTFAPASFRIGGIVSGITMTAVALLSLSAFAIRWHRRRISGAFTSRPHTPRPASRATQRDGAGIR